MPDYLAIAKQVIAEIGDQREATPTVLTQPESAKRLEAVLKGQALELWSDALGERLWLVADEADVALLGEPRGTVYTAAEARQVVKVADPSEVAEVHCWKREFNATVRDCQREINGSRGARSRSAMGSAGSGRPQSSTADPTGNSAIFCPVCRSHRLWRNDSGTLVCERCHPPGAPDLVAEWLDVAL